KIYTLHYQQRIPNSIKEAWSFFSDPKNLKVITPDYMGFDIVSGENKKIYAGQLIQYIVTPVAGIKTCWVTEITHCKEGEYFIDEQRFGPYTLWHHQHFFTEVDGGIEIEDLVHYKMPFGIIGQLVHPLLVKPKLEEIFIYRKNKLKSLFGTIGQN